MTRLNGPGHHHGSHFESMRAVRRVVAFFALSFFAHWLGARATAVLITQALRGKVFGSPDSNDIARRIVVDSDGSLYIAGITTPSRPGVQGWGSTEAGEATGKKDIFLAKFTASAKLVWVKRSGSKGDDVVNDLALSNEGLYLCGATTGRLGMDPRGSSDAFVMKFTTDGIKAWKRPFQFGSTEYDSCNAIFIDPNSRRIYLTGSTMGKLFGSVQPRKGTSNQFVCSFSEVPNDATAGLQLLQGRQTGSSGHSSGDAIAIGNNHVLLMTTEWESLNKRNRTTTYLSELSVDTLLHRKLHMIKSLDEGSFYARRMAAVNTTGDVYFVGTTYLDKGIVDYHALKYSLKDEDTRARPTWKQRVGSVAANAQMQTQTACIVADESHDVVYVAGVEDGYYANENSGVVITPLLKLRMDDGEVAQRWHRSTTTPEEKEEITDLALDLDKNVVYAGTWDGGAHLHSNTLLGSFGSRAQNSRQPGATPVATSNLHAGVVDEGGTKGRNRGRMVGYLLLGLGSLGIALTAMIAYGMRVSKRTIDGGDGDSQSGTNGIEEMRRQAVEAHRQAEGDEPESKDVVIGGSAAPC